MTLTATPDAGVAQPGSYTAAVEVNSNTPYAAPTIGVAMAVSPPPSRGKLQGTVTGVSCAGVSTGVPATVRVNLSLPYGGTPCGRTSRAGTRTGCPRGGTR